VQALRFIIKFHSRSQFKERLKSSAERFEKSHELEGIKQCIFAARRYLRKKVKDDAASEVKTSEGRSTGG
jgi:hypothetical protein